MKLDFFGKIDISRPHGVCTGLVRYLGLALALSDCNDLTLKIKKRAGLLELQAKKTMCAI